MSNGIKELVVFFWLASFTVKETAFFHIVSRPNLKELMKN